MNQFWMFAFETVELEPGEEREISLTAERAVRAKRITFRRALAGNLSVEGSVRAGSRISETYLDGDASFAFKAPTFLRAGEKMMVRVKSTHETERIRVFSALQAIELEDAEIETFESCEREAEEDRDMWLQICDQAASAGIRPEIVHAMRVTERFLTEANRSLVSLEEREEWDNAVRSFRLRTAD